jgi:hypothetical protein
MGALSFKTTLQKRGPAAAVREAAGVEAGQESRDAGEPRRESPGDAARGQDP